MTTDTENRPLDPLRDDDPILFETRYQYNDDSLVTRIAHANGNEEIFVYDETNEDRRSQGNLLVRCRLPGTSSSWDTTTSCSLPRRQTRSSKPG